MKRIKNSITGSLFLFVLLLAGCIDDQGNYDYQSADAVVPAKISGLEETYDFIFGTTRQLAAVVEGLENEDNYRFMWYMYKTPNNSSRDTLGYGKTLNFEVTQETGIYELWFEVRDKVTDVCVNRKMKVNIATVFSEGWYLVKDKDGRTDVDFITANHQLMPDILTNYLGMTLDGKAVQIHYNDKHDHEVENADGTVTKLNDQKVFYILSDRDMVVVNAENLGLYKTFGECFYEAPAVKKPENMVGSSSQLALVNNGKIHFWGGMSTNSGKFTYAKAGNYRVHPDMVDIASNRLAVFDTESRSFRYVDNNTSGLNKFSDPVPGVPSFGGIEGMNVQLKRMLFWKSVYIPNPYAMYYNAYGILQNEAGQFYLATLEFDGTNYPLKGYDELPAGCRLGEAGVQACHYSAASIYFGERNILSVHDVSSNLDPALRERDIHLFAAGEEITFIQALKNAKMDCLVVVTNSAAGWRLYTFPFIAGTSEINTSDTKSVAQGEGNVRFCMRK